MRNLVVRHGDVVHDKDLLQSLEDIGWRHGSFYNECGKSIGDHKPALWVYATSWRRTTELGLISEDERDDRNDSTNLCVQSGTSISFFPKTYRTGIR